MGFFIWHWQKNFEEKIPRSYLYYNNVDSESISRIKRAMSFNKISWKEFKQELTLSFTTFKKHYFLFIIFSAVSSLFELYATQQFPQEFTKQTNNMNFTTIIVSLVLLLIGYTIATLITGSIGHIYVNQKIFQSKEITARNFFMDFDFNLYKHYFPRLIGISFIIYTSVIIPILLVLSSSFLPTLVSRPAMLLGFVMLGITIFILAYIFFIYNFLVMYDLSLRETIKSYFQLIKSNFLFLTLYTVTFNILPSLLIKISNFGLILAIIFNATTYILDYRIIKIIVGNNLNEKHLKEN
jgi:hypothetical protein